MKTKKRILVTGSDGYIGSVLVKQLIYKGFDVVGMDTLFFKNSTLGNYKINYNLIRTDVRKLDDINLSGFDSIIHLAALSNDPMGEIDPDLTEEINYRSTVTIAKKAKAAGVRRFIFSSSCGIYGIAKNIVDENSKVRPLTAYARSKIYSENELKKLVDPNFCVCLLRNSTVYGYSPKFRNDLVVNDLVTYALAYNKLLIKSDGTPWRPLIDVRDLANIFIEFLTADSKLVNGQVINIGFKGNNFRVSTILEIIKTKLPKCQVIYTGEHGKDTRSYKVSFDKFVNLFPFIKQKWPLDRSVGNLVKNLKAVKFSNKNLETNKYTRLLVLKKLLEQGKIDNKLFWIKK